MFTRAIFSWLLQSSGVPLGFLKGQNNVFVLFFRLKTSNCFPVKTHVFGMAFIFCTFCLQWLGFEFAPARGSFVRVSDFIMTSQGYITVEHVRTWLLGSSLTKFLQSWSACFFSFFFRLFLPDYKVRLELLSLESVCVKEQGVVWFRLEVYFFRLKSSNGFSVKLISGRSFFLYFCL